MLFLLLGKRSTILISAYSLFNKSQKEIPQLPSSRFNYVYSFNKFTSSALLLWKEVLNVYRFIYPSFRTPYLRMYRHKQASRKFEFSVLTLRARSRVIVTLSQIRRRFSSLRINTRQLGVFSNQTFNSNSGKGDWITVINLKPLYLPPGFRQQFRTTNLKGFT